MKTVLLLLLFFVAETVGIPCESQLEGQNADMAARLNASESKVEKLVEELQQYKADMAAKLNASESKVEKLVEELQQCKADKLCPSGWKRFGGSCYYRITENESWQKGRDYCLKQGADLVVINSREEQDFIRGLSPIFASWIGLTRDEGRWTWVDGTPLTTGDWGYDQPGYHEDSNCAYMYHSADRGAWGSMFCSSREPSICEK